MSSARTPGEELTDEVDVLHQRASAWHERHGLPRDAVRHALAAQDVERAAGLLERSGRAMLTGSPRAFLGWLQSLPDELVREGRCSACTTRWPCSLTTSRPPRSA